MSLGKPDPEPPASRTACTPSSQLEFPCACHNRSPCHSCRSSSSPSSLPRFLEGYRLTFLILEALKTLGGKADEKEGPHLETGLGQQHEELSDKVKGSIDGHLFVPQILLHTVLHTLHSHQRLIILMSIMLYILHPSTLTKVQRLIL